MYCPLNRRNCCLKPNWCFTSVCTLGLIETRLPINETQYKKTLITLWTYWESNRLIHLFLFLCFKQEPYLLHRNVPLHAHLPDLRRSPRNAEENSETALANQPWEPCSCSTNTTGELLVSVEYLLVLKINHNVSKMLKNTLRTFRRTQRNLQCTCFISPGSRTHALDVSATFWNTACEQVLLEYRK